MSVLNQRAKLPSSRPADHLILERQRQDAARDQVLEFTRYQQTYDVKNSWLKSSDRHFLRGTVQREIRAAMKRHESDIEERRHRFVCRETFISAFLSEIFTE